MENSTISETLFREPETADAVSIQQLVSESGTLDPNSTYAYLLVCREFSQTSVVAVREGEIVGFISGFRPPERPSTLFIWQVAVSASCRRQGLARSMLLSLIARNRNRGLEWVEATVAKENRPSRRLFERVGSELGVPIVETPYFEEADFGSQEQHDAEPLLRLGPLAVLR